MLQGSCTRDSIKSAGESRRKSEPMADTSSLAAESGKKHQEVINAADKLASE